MQNRTPVTCDRCRASGIAGLGSFSAMKPLLDFAPVPRRPRSDGWTHARQRAFIAALAETGSVSNAAKAVNMSAEGAYYLRRQPGADEFRAAWESALDHGGEIVDGAALERSVHGVAVPIFHAGKQVGERRMFNERLTMFLLQHRKPKTYGHARRGDRDAADQARAGTIREEALARHDEWVEKLSRLYGARVAAERRCRLDGDIVAADFYLRQLTHMEVLLELGGGGKHLLFWAEGGTGAGDHPCNGGEPVYGTEVTELLDAHRREAWAKAGEPDRPKLTTGRAGHPHGITGGPDLEARKRLLKDAKSRAATAQAMLEEALADQVRARARRNYERRRHGDAANNREPGAPGQPAPSGRQV
jgi:hypothetical protein